MTGRKMYALYLPMSQIHPDRRDWSLDLPAEVRYFFYICRTNPKTGIMKSHLLIGAATSGSGKTTFTMGLLRVLYRRGLKVQPFKCGPDYIDTQFHTIAASRTSVNLDTWMASEGHVRSVYHQYSDDADVSVTEGVMGLFDGYNRMKGSSAEIARLLKIPVILILNARSSAYTVAAILHGLKTFDPKIHVVGVVFNQVSSAAHYAYLKEACADVGLVDLGYLPKAEQVQVPSRHLGLSLDVKQKMESLIDRVADLIEQHVDVDRLLTICGDYAVGTYMRDTKAAVSDSGHAQAEPLFKEIPLAAKDLKISVACDAAFNFMYRKNLDRLSEAGKLTFFSPLAGDRLPESDFIYLPGGYPELFASQLTRNQRLMIQIRDYVEKGGRMLAECGGMMYLTRSITTQSGEIYPMAGVLPLEATMEEARLHLGYRSTTCNGFTLRGHEFHYSNIRKADNMPSVMQQFNAKGQKVDTPLYRYKNVIAGYTHWYWGEADIFRLWNNE